MKITVAIPTISGREGYLASSIETCITQDFDAMEILVSDNSFGKTAKDLVEGYQDERIKYISPDMYLPMSAHWDFVVSHVSGDLFTIIGDDDGLMPGSMDRVGELYNEYGYTIIHHTLCNYTWPDFYSQEKCNTIQFFHNVDNTIERKACADVLKGLCQGTLRYVDGPMVYHNFIPTSIIRRATKNRKFFSRASPDVYSSVALSAICENFLAVGECLTISGQGARANGASVKKAKTDGEIFLSEMKEYYRPRFKSRTIQLALLDCVYEVSEVYNRPDLLYDINIHNHLLMAARELKGIHGIKNVLTELAEILTIAKDHGEIAPLFRVFLDGIAPRGRFTGRSNRLGVQSPPKEDVVLRKGLTLQCDESVNNIYQASRYLSRQLRKSHAVTGRLRKDVCRRG